MCDVHVVLLNWNGAQDTLECLESLMAQEGVCLEVIVVDNCSKDDSVELIRARYPRVIVIENDRNLGFPAGNNAGIRLAFERNAKNIFILNNDTIARPGMIRQLLSHVSDEVGLVTPAIFYASQPDQIWSIGGMIHPLFLEMVPRPDHRPKSLPEVPVERDFVTGCAMLVRADVLRDAGLFDDNFFPGYYEDLDLCLRIRRKGYRMLLVPQAHLLHKVSQSSGGPFSPRVYYLMGRNSGFYFRKHMHFWQAPFILAYRLGSAFVTTGKLIVSRRFECLSAYWSGLIRGWTGLPKGAGEKYLSHYL
jgi:GT2 family glycosyltransferase